MSNIPKFKETAMQPSKPFSEKKMKTPATTLRMKASLVQSAPATKSTPISILSKRQQDASSTRLATASGSKVNKNKVAFRRTLDIGTSIDGHCDAATCTDVPETADVSVSPEILSCDTGTSTSTSTGQTVDMGISTDQSTSTDATTSTDVSSANAETQYDAISSSASSVNVISPVNVINIINAINVMNVINATTESNITAENQGVVEEKADLNGSNQESHKKECQASNFLAIEPPCSSIACSLCDCKGFFNQEMLELHVRYVHKKIWHCAICPPPPPDKKPYSCRNSLCRHYDDKHNKHWRIMKYFLECFTQERFIYSQVALKTPWVFPENEISAAKPMLRKTKRQLVESPRMTIEMVNVTERTRLEAENTEEKVVPHTINIDEGLIAETENIYEEMVPETEKNEEEMISETMSVHKTMVPTTKNTDEGMITTETNDVHQPMILEPKTAACKIQNDAKDCLVAAVKVNFAAQEVHSFLFTILLALLIILVSITIITVVSNNLAG